jgi:hypothetical protein
MEESNLIFLFSLPRSGSTLLQRMLANCEAISTNGESALMLPLLFRKTGLPFYAAYNVQVFERGINDLVSLFEHSWDDYNECLSEFALSLYAKALGPKENFFLDKTPRYSLIAPELVSLFPKAKYIFLWRDPVRVVDSCIRTLWSYKWTPSRLQIDLDVGVKKLCDAAQILGSDAFHLKYEELVVKPQEIIDPLIEWMGCDCKLPVDGDLPPKTGSLGDPALTSRSSKIFTESASKKVETLHGLLRKRWILSKINDFPKDYFMHVGRSRRDLVDEISSFKNLNLNLLGDACRGAESWMDSYLDISVRKERILANVRYVCR